MRGRTLGAPPRSANAICPKILSKTRMPGKWGGARWAHPPDLPMQYVPKYHQKLGCQANGGAHTGRAPPRSANDLYFAHFEQNFATS